MRLELASFPHLILLWLVTEAAALSHGTTSASSSSHSHRKLSLPIFVAGMDQRYEHHGEDWVTGECASRERQSPIDFADAAPWACNISETAAKGCFRGFVFFQYFSVGPAELFQGAQRASRFSSIDLVDRGIGGAWVDGRRFDLRGVQVRVQAEHTFRGQRPDLELQLIHQLRRGEQTLVVALLFKQAETGTSQQSEVVTSLVQALSGDQSSTQSLGMNLIDLVTNASYFQYDGSETAPPCAETATWLVRTDILHASADQIAGLKAILMKHTGSVGNWRSQMPLMGRPIYVRLARHGPRDTAPPGPSRHVANLVIPSRSSLSDGLALVSRVPASNESASADSHATVIAHQALERASEAAHLAHDLADALGKATVQELAVLGTPAPDSSALSQPPALAEDTRNSFTDSIRHQRPRAQTTDPYVVAFGPSAWT